MKEYDYKKNTSMVSFRRDLCLDEYKYKIVACVIYDGCGMFRTALHHLAG